MSANLKKAHNELNKFYKSKNYNDVEELKKHLDIAKNAIGSALDSSEAKLNQQRSVPSLLTLYLVIMSLSLHAQ